MHGSSGKTRRTLRWTSASKSEHGIELSPDPNGFLLASYLPAWRARERRVALDDAICPILRANLAAAVQTLASWNPWLGAPPRVEAPEKARAPQGGVASFLSGGVDSLATLRVNRTELPSSHPEAISAAILVDYQDISGISAAETVARYRERTRIIETICTDAGVEPVLLRTNARALDSSMKFWMCTYHGSLLAGLAHFLSNRFRKVHIAATFDAANLAPWGSHPLLDPYYSSAHLQVAHHGLEMSRFTKTAIVADWPVALNNLNVCVSKRSQGRNCGRCEKCLRTMLALLSLGRLAECQAFDQADIRPDDLSGLVISNDYQASCYRDVARSLRQQGRADLARIVDRKIITYVHPLKRRAAALMHLPSTITRAALNRWPR
jgi:hypothetical protein